MNDLHIETQFSIYKLDNLKITEEFFPDKKTATQSDILEALLHSIEIILHEKKNCINSKRIVFENYCGIAFKTLHVPDWKNVIQQTLLKNEHENESEFEDDKAQRNDFLQNSNVSYILFYICRGSIYAMTGGYGSFYINRFTEKNYGLYLLPKILNKEHSVVKNVIENNLTGNLISTHRNNRANTSFSFEQDLSSIYKQLNIEIDRDIAEALGVEFESDESSRKKVNLVNGGCQGSCPKYFK